MGGDVLRFVAAGSVPEGLANKLKMARKLSNMSTRAVAATLAPRVILSHATLANYESGRSSPPTHVLVALSTLYERPLSWFLARGKALHSVQFRNLKPRIRMSDLHVYEADSQRQLDAYKAIETALDRPLKRQFDLPHVEPSATAEELALQVRSGLGISREEPVSSAIEVVEKFGIRVLENDTELSIDGLAARYDDEFVVILNPAVSNDRARLNTVQELGRVIYGDGEPDLTLANSSEERALDFASHLLLPNNQLKSAFEGQSMVRLVQFKERFGISLSAMIYRAEKQGFITKPIAKMLGAEFARRGWRTNEPGLVRPDRATRFEQLIEEVIASNKLSLKEVADLVGVRPEMIRERLSRAMGIEPNRIPKDEGMNTLGFPG